MDHDTNYHELNQRPDESAMERQMRIAARERRERRKKLRRQRRIAWAEDAMTVLLPYLTFALILIAVLMAVAIVGELLRDAGKSLQTDDKESAEVTALPTEDAQPVLMIEEALVFSDGPAAEEYAYIHFPFSEDVPLSYEEQEALFDACEEFSVDYPLMLALIERETHFRNVVGDGGNSYGYCQIQPRWWSETAESIGVTDLMEPEGNFRTGCAILTHLLDVYGCGNLTDALTAYNTGHGGASEYARDVLEKQEKWQGVIGALMEGGCG